jgi:hypothetical protein
VAIFAGAFRSWHGAIHLVERSRSCSARQADSRRVSSATDRSCRACARPPRRVERRRHRRRPAARSDARGPRRRRHRRAPFDIGATRRSSLGFYWSPLKIFEYMAAGLPVVAPAVDRIPSLVADGREGCCTTSRRDGGSHAGALADALTVDATRRSRADAGGGGPRRARSRDYSWAAHCRALETALIDAAREAPPDEDPDPDRRVSTRLRRQRLEHLRTCARLCAPGPRRHRSSSRSRERSPGIREIDYDGSGAAVRAPAPDIPYVRNYTRARS